MKKISSVVACMCMIILMLTGCSKSDSGDAKTEASSGGIKVALVTPVGGLGDRSFSDSAWVRISKSRK